MDKTPEKLKGGGGRKGGGGGGGGVTGRRGVAEGERVIQSARKQVPDFKKLHRQWEDKVEKVTH